MEARIRRHQVEALDFEGNRYPNEQKWSASQGWTLDGDEVVLRQFIRVLGGVALALIVSSCSRVVATPQTTTTSTVASSVKPPVWGVPTKQSPSFFYASDVSEQARDRVEETFAVATTHWPKYGPLEIWVTGVKPSAILGLVNDYCARRVELEQMDKFVCLNEYRYRPFEEYRTWSAIDAVEGTHRMQGQLSNTEKYGFLQIVVSYPAGFTEDFSEYAGDVQQVIFHEYFHAVQRSAIPQMADIDFDLATRKRLFGPPWFSEGSAEFMSLRAVSDLRQSGQLPIYEGVLDDFVFHDLMVEKLDAAKASLLRYKKVTLSDADHLSEKLSPYHIGAWAVAYLVHKTNPNVLLDTFYPNIAKLGWAKTFKLSFGISPAQFETEFMKFMKLTTDEQTPILVSE